MKLISKFSQLVSRDFLELNDHDRMRFLATLLREAAPHLPTPQGDLLTGAAMVRRQIENVLPHIPGGPL